jgi:hypothetical protein
LRASTRIGALSGYFSIAEASCYQDFWGISSLPEFLSLGQSKKGLLGGIIIDDSEGGGVDIIPG